MQQGWNQRWAIRVLIGFSLYPFALALVPGATRALEALGQVVPRWAVGIVVVTAALGRAGMVSLVRRGEGPRPPPEA